MPLTFKSQATANLIVLDKVARQLFKIIGEDPLQPGILTVEKIPVAIAALQNAVLLEKNKAQQPTPQKEDEDMDDEDEPFNNKQISLEQRVWPLIEMLKTSLAADEPVVWGV